MKAMIMKAKHWQVFLGWVLLYGFYSLIDPAAYPTLYSAARVLLYVAYFGWFLVLERTLKTYLRPGLPFSSGLFTVCVLFLIVAIGTGAFAGPNPSGRPGQSITLEGVIVFPFLFAFFYLPYHIGKLLAIVENPKAMTFSRHFGETVLFLFYPLGIWLLQPRINELYTHQRIEEPHGP